MTTSMNPYIQFRVFYLNMYFLTFVKKLWIMDNNILDFGDIDNDISNFEHRYSCIVQHVYLLFIYQDKFLKYV